MTNSVYKLHVVERGKGRPVILLHGGLSTHRYWTQVAGELEDKRRLFMPDLLGFGASPKPRRADYSVEQFVACLDETFRQYRFKEPPVLAGHSMGANIALRWVLARPRKFSGLVLSSPLLFEQSSFYQQLATLPLEGKWLANKGLARAVAFAMGLSRLVPMPVAIKFAHDRPRYVVEDVTSQRFFVYRKLLKHAYFREDVLAELQKVHLPTRIVVGDQDFIANHAFEHIEKICTSNQQCQMTILPGSHQTLLEHPKEIARVILSL